MDWLQLQQEVMGGVPQAYLDDVRNNPSPLPQYLDLSNDVGIDPITGRRPPSYSIEEMRARSAAGLVRGTRENRSPVATRTRDQAVLDGQVRARNNNNRNRNNNRNNNNNNRNSGNNRNRSGGSGGGGGGGGKAPMGAATINPKDILANKGMLEFINRQALRQFNTGGPRVFGQSRVADLSNITNQAINRTRDIATDPVPGLNTANRMVNQTMQGGYLEGSPVFGNLQSMAAGDMVGNNPYLDRVSDTLYRDIGDQISARFGASGRTGGAYNVQAMSRGFGDAIAPIYANQYNQDVGNQLTANSLLSRDYDAERNRMLSSAGLLPSLDQLRYSGLSELAAAGRARDDFAQRRLTDRALRFDANQLRPQNNLAFLSQIAGTAIPGKLPTAAPAAAPQPSLGNRLLTGGLLGSSLGSAITGGSLLGTGIGGLLGVGSAFL